MGMFGLLAMRTKIRGFFATLRMTTLKNQNDNGEERDGGHLRGL
jgi:hypothetical protein